jgi:hypothetical protein
MVTTLAVEFTPEVVKEQLKIFKKIKKNQKKSKHFKTFQKNSKNTKFSKKYKIFQKIQNFQKNTKFSKKYKKFQKKYKKFQKIKSKKLINFKTPQYDRYAKASVAFMVTTLAVEFTPEVVKEQLKIWQEFQEFTDAFLEPFQQARLLEDTDDGKLSPWTIEGVVLFQK